MESEKDHNTDPQWFSLGTISRWLWEATFTRTGAYIVVTACLSVMAYYAYQLGNPWLIILSPILIIPFGLLLFVTSAITTFGDFIADWFIAKIFARPDPHNTLHSTVYFVFSCAGFIIMVIYFSLGNPDVSGYWHH